MTGSHRNCKVLDLWGYGRVAEFHAPDCPDAQLAATGGERP